MLRAGVSHTGAERRAPINSQLSTLNSRSGFTLVEVMVVMTLLVLIVVALMGVFSATQSAFRASITQTDVLESGRAAMDLITGDLRTMKPSGESVGGGAVNFYVNAYPNSAPLLQTLVGVSDPLNTRRTNVQQNVFILSQDNLNGVPTWSGTGYAVWLSDDHIYSLYRFSTNLPVARAGAVSNLFSAFYFNFLNAPTNYSHLLDGVVGFRVHAFDPNGGIINYTRTNYFYTNSVPALPAVPNQSGEIGYWFYSNAVPATVEIEMSTLEDRSLQRAESRPYGPVRDQYLQSQAGRVHVFRQRVAIPNVIPAAYP